MLRVTTLGGRGLRLGREMADTKLQQSLLRDICGCAEFCNPTPVFSKL